MHRVLDVLTFACWIVGVLGLLLRYAVQDRVPALAVAFYVLPPLVAVVVLAASLGLSLRRSRKRWKVVVSGVLTMMAVAAWIQTDWFWAQGADAAAEPLRVVLWNAARPSASDESFLPILQEADAQILVLVESGGHSAGRRHFWESHFPDYHVCLLEGEIVLLSRYPIASVHCTTVGGATRIAEYDLVLPGGTLSIVGVDVAAVPYALRQLPLDRITETAFSKAPPVILLGDFNTPHTSILFDDLRRSFCHAFEESGTGLITTWPAFFPALALDHIWLSEGLTPVRTVLRRTRYSDHAIVIADISIEKLGDPPELVTSID
jgi:endonuclease/exonuclease/phosphatase (EEP) superfamily protein YafD